MSPTCSCNPFRKRQIVEGTPETSPNASPIITFVNARAQELEGISIGNSSMPSLHRDCEPDAIELNTARKPVQNLLKMVAIVKHTVQLSTQAP